ncbi:universal stress protein [Thioalbus denitrificans]|uniref:Nucleotide-binding universal stress UspA family protein n=1 Tax=Thioalbus denitrificans TaxID=547122 RepID=A0A369CHE8_9GAMM|nr:universal stress protein [Thioalbus denitrificans]RCX31264.1 nucleotide-binding universal stress UspA family protein [Thioalbus denitrificans]
MSAQGTDNDIAVPAYLVPVDFGAPARAALVHAAELAAEGRGRLLILHVLHEPVNRPGLYQRASGRRRGLTPLQAGAGSLLQAFLAALRQERPDLTALERAQTLLVRGLPAECIVAVAGQRAVAAIILGRRRRNGLSRWLNGSVGDQVLRRARCPVTLVPPAIPCAGAEAPAAAPVSAGSGASAA